jgi:hypothetical protein
MMGKEPYDASPPACLQDILNIALIANNIFKGLDSVSSTSSCNLGLTCRVAHRAWLHTRRVFDASWERSQLCTVINTDTELVLWWEHERKLARQHLLALLRTTDICPSTWTQGSGAIDDVFGAALIEAVREHCPYQLASRLAERLTFAVCGLRTLASMRGFHCLGRLHITVHEAAMTALHATNCDVRPNPGLLTHALFPSLAYTELTLCDTLRAESIPTLWDSLFGKDEGERDGKDGCMIEDLVINGEPRLDIDDVVNAALRLPVLRRLTCQHISCPRPSMHTWSRARSLRLHGHTRRKPHEHLEAFTITDTNHNVCDGGLSMTVVSALSQIFPGVRNRNGLTFERLYIDDDDDVDACERASTIAPVITLGSPKAAKGVAHMLVRARARRSTEERVTLLDPSIVDISDTSMFYLPNGSLHLASGCSRLYIIVYSLEQLAVLDGDTLGCLRGVCIVGECFSSVVEFMQALKARMTGAYSIASATVFVFHDDIYGEQGIHVAHVGNIDDVGVTGWTTLLQCRRLDVNTLCSIWFSQC